MSLTDIYIDIWQLIVPYLSINDLLNLRASSKAMNQLISSDVLWSNIVKTRWFSIEDVPKDPFREIHHGYLDYFIHRSEQDCEFLHHLTDMKTSNDQKFVLGKAYTLIKETNFEFIHLLLKLKRDNKYLKMKFISTNLLNSIRRKQCLELLDEGFEKYNVEEYFFKLSYLDPAFDDLLPYRNKVLAEVIDRLELLLSDDQDKPPTFKVNLIVETFFNVCKCQLDYNSIQGGFSDNNAEEISILRVYAGEVSGLLWIRYAILQKLANHFNIKSYVTDSFLIIEDPHFYNGISLLFLKGDKPQFITVNYALQLFQEQTFANATKPITSKNILEIPSSSSQFNSILSKVRIDDNVLKPFLKVFPKSKIPFNYKILDMLLFYSKDKPAFRMYSFESFSFDSQIKEFPFDLGVFFRRFNDFHYPLPSDFFQLPFEDRHIIYDEDEVDTALPEPEFQIGQVVFHPRYKSFGVVLCPIYEERLGIDSGKYMITYNVLTIKSISTVWYQPWSFDDVTTDLLRLVLTFPLLGKYFDRFDDKTNMFIPNSLTREKLHEKLMINHFHE